MIADPSGASPQFDDQTLQDKLDEHRDDIWQEPLKMAPAIVNAASTNNIPTMIFADYYSNFKWWESDVVLQGNDVNTHASWVVLTPVASDLLVGHWQFETNVFTSGTAPGQYPPVFATGKIYDLYAASADLLEFWAATLTANFDFTSDGQSFRRSQVSQTKMALAAQYRRLAKPKIAKMTRRDVVPSISSKSVPLLDGNGGIGGSY